MHLYIQIKYFFTGKKDTCMYNYESTYTKHKHNNSIYMDIFNEGIGFDTLEIKYVRLTGAPQ